MNGPSGPSPGFLTLFNQGLLGGPGAPPPSAAPNFTAMAGQALGAAPASPQPQPIMLGNQPVSAPPVASVAPPPPPPPPAGPQGYEDPLKGMSVAGAPPPPPPVSGDARLKSGGPDRPFNVGVIEGKPPPARFTPFGGGVVPAHELERRGPSLRNAEESRNAEFAGAIDAVRERGAQTSAMDFALALDQERKANIRQDAADYSAAERTQELADRQADFDQSVKALSRQAMDPDRFWASRNTGQKIASVVSVALGGFLQGMRGGPNVGLEILNRHIDNDIKAQEFAYNATRDTVAAKQTAFGLAMQKYQNEDAARAAARAAALDAVQAQVAQQAALWKGTDSQNRADMAMAALQDEKMKQIAQGILFLPATQGAVMYRDAETGLSYTAGEMKSRQAAIEQRAFELQKQGLGEEAALRKAVVEAGLKTNDKAQEGAQHIASQLQGAGVPQARASAEQALRALNLSEGGKAEAAARWGLGETLGRMVMSENANAREQAYQSFSNAAMKAMMGNVTASEEERARKQLGSAADPESRRRAIAATLDTLATIEKNAKAGASPEAQRRFDENRQAASGAPPAAPPGSKAGW